MVDNCIGINNRRYYLMLLNTITFLLFLAVYPLSLLGNVPSHGQELRVVASTQLISATVGSVLALIYTFFAWYAALTGLYQVDTYSGLMIKENPRKKL